MAFLSRCQLRLPYFCIHTIETGIGRIELRGCLINNRLRGDALFAQRTQAPLFYLSQCPCRDRYLSLCG
ncbi:MAG: hypothetical protein ACI955_002347 [Zhongshania sp.]|jgi:hypothetical protein